MEENCFKVTPLFTLLNDEDGEGFFAFHASSFVSRNKDVELFLKQKAVQSVKLSTSSTYLVMREGGADLLGYFTLALKMLTIKSCVLSSSQEKTIRRFGSFDAETESYKLPAVLLAQFGRNFSETSASIDGKELMNSALKCIKTIFSLSSGKTAFLECEPSEKLICFYERCGFSLLGNTTVSKDKKELVQMFRFV